MNDIAKGTLYGQLPEVAALNKVKGFDPMKFAHKVFSSEEKKERLDLDLKYKKLWFRLKYPQGRIKMSPMKITHQVAIIEAKIYLNREDSSPVSSFIAQRMANATPGGLYIEAAQHAAVDQALTDAGFGLQFCDANSGKEGQNTNMSAQENVSAEDVSVEQPPLDEAVPAGTIPAEPAQAESIVSPPTQQEVANDVTEQAAEEAFAVEPDIEESLVVEQSAVEQPASAPDEVVASGEAIRIEPPLPDVLGEEHIQLAAQDEILQPIEEPDADVTQPMEEPRISAEEVTEETAPRFTRDMAVEDILAVMTLQEAMDVIVESGTCSGWPLSQVADRRPASLRWYLNGYTGDNNILRAGATMMLSYLQERETMEKAS